MVCLLIISLSVCTYKYNTCSDVVAALTSDAGHAYAS